MRPTCGTVFRLLIETGRPARRWTCPSSSQRASPNLPNYRLCRVGDRRGTPRVDAIDGASRIGARPTLRQDSRNEMRLLLASTVSASSRNSELLAGLVTAGPFSCPQSALDLRTGCGHNAFRHWASLWVKWLIYLVQLGRLELPTS